jgi:uncharacterized membrane protein
MRTPRQQPFNDQAYQRTRTLLRTCGIVVLAVGVVFTAIGLVSFFSAFGSFLPPTYFWCAFVGLPVTFVGLAMLQFGFMGAVNRYAANETVPVASDAAKQVIGGSKELLQDIVHPIGDIEGRLEKLARLKADGLVTQAEYDAKRAEIIKAL